MIKDFLEISKKIIIVIDPDADFDQFAGFISLAKLLRDNKKEVSLLIPKNVKTSLFLKLFPTEDLKVMDKPISESFIVSLRKNGAVVKEVKWKEDEGKINIYVTTRKGNIDSENADIKPNLNVFDAIILFGVKDLANVKSVYDLEEDFFNKSKTVQIGNLHIDLGTYKFNEVSEIYSLLVYKLAQELEIELSGMIETDLLAGIFWKSRGLFRYADNSIIKVIYELSKSKANIKGAQEKAFKRNTMQDIQILDLIIKNLNINSENIAYSIVHNAQSKGVNLDFIISSNWHQLDRLKNVDYGFILFEYPNKVKGIVFSSDNIDLSSKLQNIKKNGDRYEIFFETDKKIEEIKELLLNLKSSKKDKMQKELKTDKKKDKLNEKKIETDTANVNYDPLAPASVMPDPLSLQNDQEASDQKSGYTSPPPINPIN